MAGYAGVTNHHRGALNAWPRPKSGGATQDVRDQIAGLERQQQRQRMPFTGRGATQAPGEEAEEKGVAVLDDEQLPRGLGGRTLPQPQQAPRRPAQPDGATGLALAEERAHSLAGVRWLGGRGHHLDGVGVRLG